MQLILDTLIKMYSDSYKMDLPAIKWWKIRRMRKKVDALGKEILKSLAKQNLESLETGNLRKSDEWGILQENILYWIAHIDIISPKPVQYIIAYSLDTRKFSCYSKSSGTQSSIFQFETSDYNELKSRLLELALHISSLRERMLRELLYNESKKGPRKKWYNPFVRKETIHHYLHNVADNLLTQKKITKKEYSRLISYAEHLIH